MTTAENTIKELISALDKHTTNYNLTEDTEGIYTLETLAPEAYEELKFIIKEHSSQPIRTLDYDGVEEHTLTVDDFVTYVFS